MIKFYHGCMGCGKTTTMVHAVDIYKRKGYNVLVAKPAIDNREGEFSGWGITASRAQPEKKIPCYYYNNIADLFKQKFDCLIIDEAQFMKAQDVRLIKNVTDATHSPVLAYGLMYDVNGNKFEGAEALSKMADIMVEIPSLCDTLGCKDNAKVHARYIDGKRDTSGKSIVIEKGNVTYKSVCWKHWKLGR